MEGTKAKYLSNFSKKNQINFCRFDYFGHGKSSKEFQDCTITDWLDNGIKIIDNVFKGPIILIGSSMGGWVSLLASLKRKKRIKGIVLIAPAVDMTERLMLKSFSLKEKKEIKSKGLGGVTAVGQGSKNEPRFIILEYRNGKKGQKPILLVGKAVTFDTGGISLKPGEKMDEMKFDKCGGCTVLGIMKAISELKLPINVVAIIPSVENMPGGEAYRPGDIIKLFNGKTAEILNTDAEGRLILADGLAYGIKHYQPSSVMDFATLTGACIVALGTNVAAIVSNNSKLSSKIKKSSSNTSEEVWELPINDDYMDMVKSKVADIRNIGMGRAAGTITAAAFLANAVGNVPWVHFDIAGTAWIQPSTKNKSYNAHGATGFGVRLVVDHLMNQK